jgi:Uncharacterised protein conserved in bacteria (DUF2336)
MVEQLNPGMNVPTGVTNDALVATMVSYLKQREADGSSRENDIIAQLVASLASRMSPEAGAQINAALAQLESLTDITSADLVAPTASGEQGHSNCVADETAEAVEASDIAAAAPASSELDEWAAAFDAAENGADPEHAVVETIHHQPATEYVAMGEASELAVPEDDDPSLDLAFAAPVNPVMTSVMVQAASATIAPELANAIIASGSLPAILAVLANPDAVLTRSSLTTLSELAVSDLSLKQALCSRADLPEAIVDRLWPFLSLTSRAGLLHAGLTISPDAAAAMRDDIIVENQERLQAGDEVLTVAQALADVNDQNWSLGDAVTALAGSGGVAEVGLLLAQIAGVNETAALALFLGNYDRGTVMLARAADADEGAFEAILAVRGRSGARRTSDRRSPMFAFQATGMNEARDVIAQILLLQQQKIITPGTLTQALAA